NKVVWNKKGVTVMTENDINVFPFDHTLLEKALHEPLLKYEFSTKKVDGVDYLYVMEWQHHYLNSANAMKYLTIVSEYDPQYVGSDGHTTVSERALQHMRSVI